MPGSAIHPNPNVMLCPLCGKYPEKKLDEGGYDYFSCKCGDANPGEVTVAAKGIWNYLVEEREKQLLHKIAKKLGIVV